MPSRRNDEMKGFVKVLSWWMAKITKYCRCVSIYYRIESKTYFCWWRGSPLLCSVVIHFTHFLSIDIISNYSILASTWTSRVDFLFAHGQLLFKKIIINQLSVVFGVGFVAGVAVVGRRRWLCSLFTCVYVRYTSYYVLHFFMCGFVALCWSVLKRSDRW
jgi:hypothetical protein